ncbi:hypothetical protein BD309DRAFT_955581 [Dichomitus squalens]|uniref:SUR7/PalI family-domain-containing protein n=1 Tax=Dichomitus squalens TaxID=114155 RepID=A0A4Q9Q727_9APHY|nr:uncharacterized protein DICSQDRAFT_153060 [Dichomitus squalens LYAD-421 SS1]EJF64876.1 hypothetical protein DICSQDRAFT_153060 [Dichomitus squalens LYAD-421 SS1]TBU33374.1 hypothetical protein BD311DRAFT_784953 [Dichomitus squalens]TBU45710.1 hypothetical protein BD309DRAFT_955581 [Dichomitus squalens]TBU62771.1 hypothetical protein BD310DRAFT_918143 [Dichomitus squalens]
MCGPALLMFMATVAALVLLVLVIFSTPFIQQFYFLRSEAAGGIRFGVVGFCLELTGICTKQIGYNLDDILIKPLPMLLVLYPVAAGLTLLGAFTLLPIFFSHHRHPPRWPYILFALVSTLAFLAAAAALAVSVYLFTKVRDHFHAQHVEAAYGPSIWMAVAATAVLLVVALNAGCGTCLGGRFGRQARHHVYTY